MAIKAERETPRVVESSKEPVVKSLVGKRLNENGKIRDGKIGEMRVEHGVIKKDNIYIEGVQATARVNISGHERTFMKVIATPRPMFEGVWELIAKATVTHKARKHAKSVAKEQQRKTVR